MLGPRGNPRADNILEIIKILQANEKVRLRVEAKRKGHPLSTLRRVAKVLHARVRVSFEREKKAAGTRVAESGARYGRSATKGVKKAS